ncbi:MAG TPA: isoprenylcysteine carboxylmethyltransferase family protein [Candidatus Limnocylindrales bacterium]|nr:isoprenylcysteine carboxylmethyltransferase family protein [Candidatus Limnocylindrales bacterium]
MLWRLVKTLLFTLVMPGTIGVYLPQALRAHHRALPMPEGLAGAAIIACGAAIYFWCAWDFVSKGLGTPLPIDAPRVLVANGLYRFSRNPMYVGVSSVIFGQAIYYSSASVAIYGCVVLLAFHSFVMLYEEPTLKRLFGQQYEEYCRKVPRWVFRFSRA